jgi:hypothetical protein
VKGDPYELVFAAGRYVADGAKTAAGAVKTVRAGGAVRATIVPEKSGEAAWEVAFAPCPAPAAELVPLALDLAPGQTGQLAVENPGPAPARFKIRSSDPRVRLSVQDGEVGPWPAAVKVAVTADAPPGAGPAHTARVTLEAEDGRSPPQEAQVRVIAPPAPAPAEGRGKTPAPAPGPRPQGLAAGAKATASSTWGQGYEAARVNDGDRGTRWNTRDGDTGGCWIELAWEKPVSFDQVVIDECMNFGPRIQAWKLLAGDGELKEIAAGRGMGRLHAVTLERPVEARRLRLLIEKASTVPTIWEIEVQQTGKGPGSQ